MAFTVGVPYISYPISLLYQSGGFDCEYELRHSDYRFFDLNNLYRDNDFEFSLLIENNVFKVSKENWSLYKLSHPEFVRDIIYFKIYEFSSINISPEGEKANFRYISPIHKNDIDFFLFQISGSEWHFFNSARRIQDSFLIEISIHDSIYHIFKVALQEETYLVIENLSPVTLKEFDNGVMAIIFGIGFVIQSLLFDESFTFLIDSPKSPAVKGMRYQSLRKSIRGHYKIFDVNAYKYLIPIGQRNNTDSHELAAKWSSKLSRFPLDALERLVNLCYDYPKIVTCILMLVEGSLNGLETEGPVLSVALETITEVIKNMITGLPKPPGKLPESTFNQLLIQFMATVDSSSLSKKEKDKLKEWLKGINKPSNRDKFLVPFNYFNITLTNEDKAIIEKRNTWIHGSNKITLNQTGFIKEIINCKKMHLYSCILILKLAGFSGYVVDNSCLELSSLKPSDLNEVFLEI